MIPPRESKAVAGREQPRQNSLTQLNKASAQQLPAGVLAIVTLLLLAGVMYFVVLSISTGHYHVGCLQASLVVIAMCGGAVAIRPGGRLRSYALLAPIVLLLLLIQSLLACWIPSGLMESTPEEEFRFAGVAAVITALAIVGCIILNRRHRRKAMLAILLTTTAGLFGLNAWMQSARPPAMDVWFFHHDADAALVHGENPYAITYLNTLNYDGLDDSPYYSLEVQKNGRLLFGYPYPPLCLLMVLPGELLFHDARFALVACYLAAAVLIALMDRGSGVAICAGASLMLSPCAYAVYRAAWTEPEMMLLLAWIAWCGLRKSPWLPVALGLFLAVKQYCPIFAPLVFLLLPRPMEWRTSARFLAIIAITACVITLPLALWDWRAFWNSTVHIQMIQPFRYDSFSFLAMYANSLPQGSAPPQSWIAFVAAMAVELVLLSKLPRNIAGFTLGVGVTMMAFLFLNRQSFLNYHTFGAAALLIAAATFERQYARAAQVERQ